MSVKQTTNRDDAARVEKLLRGTPYSVPEEGVGEFIKIHDRNAKLAEKAKAVGERIQREAAEVFDAFGLTLRSELVAESNRMEHLNWTADEVRDLVLKHRDLLDASIHNFIAGLEGDPHAYEALGLYRAQLLADEWARSGNRPREYEIRQLHAIITSGEEHAGRYKRAGNKISGAEHQPPGPEEAERQMRELSAWLLRGTGDPALDATVVHAWLAHLHPFDDGNGRMSRLLANLCLTQGGYPPLIIPASTFREEYYDALAKSDEGDILPLYGLFARCLKSAVTIMGAKDYVENVIRDRTLFSSTERQRLWQLLVGQFYSCLSGELSEVGWGCRQPTYPSPGNFELLTQNDSEGNSWFTVIHDDKGVERWLLWFGYNSTDVVALYSEHKYYPSIYLSIANPVKSNGHPFDWVKGRADSSHVSEILAIPGRISPVAIQEGVVWDEVTVKVAVSKLMKTLLDFRNEEGRAWV